MPRKITKLVYTFKELLEAAAHPDPESPVNDKSVERARSWLQEGQTDHDWYDYIYEMWGSALHQIGFEDAQIQFSGFWSQGDGASFTSGVDLDKLVAFMSTKIEPKDSIDVGADEEEDFRPWVMKQVNGVHANPKFTRLLWVRNALDGNCVVKRNSHHYSHENTCSFDGSFRDTGHSTLEPKWEWVSDQPRLRKLANSFFEACETLREDLCRAIYKSLQEEFTYLNEDEQLIDMSEANDYTFDEDGRRE